MSSWEEKLSTPDSSSDLYALPENEEDTGTNEEGNSQAEEDYFRPIKKLRMMPSSESGPKALTSFLIEDILRHPKSERAIVRPWDSPSRRPSTEESRSESDSSTSPLAALFQMTSKAFQEKAAEDPALNLFSHRQPSKKKRKSRTAFTNHQIFELEKRFLYQKYLSPADRDEIAQSLGLSNAQVITWFQNRRAKLKRDMEELKKDVDAATVSIRDSFPEMKFHSSANSPRL